jgi:hypothetical protein
MIKKVRVWELRALCPETKDQVMTDITTTLPPVVRLSRDLAMAAATMTKDEARFLVDAYYMMQEDRKRAHNQVRAMNAEPHSVIAWLAEQSSTLETQLQRALDKYTDGQPKTAWMKNLHGIGPVISAGFIAHIDLAKAPTAGNIWNFAGLNPTVKWEKGQRRPWNSKLKTLCCHPSTMITTKRGSVPITEVVVNDEVLTHRGRWRRVKAVHCSKYSGSLISLSTYGNTAAPLLITDNHPIRTEIRLSWTASKGRSENLSFGAKDRKLPAKCLPDEQIRVMREERATGAKLVNIAERYGCSIGAVSQICNRKTRQKPRENERMWVRADGIMPGWLLSSPRLPEGCIQTVSIPKTKGKQKKHLPKNIIVDEEMARLLGLYVAEGCASTKRHATSFSLHKNEIEYQEFIKHVMSKRLGLTCSIQIHDNSWQATYYSKQLASWLTNFAGFDSFSIRVPEAVLTSTNNVRAAFLRGWFEGDGHLTNDSVTLCCSTESAIHDAHAMLVSLGIISSITPFQNSYKLTVSNTDHFNEMVFEGQLPQSVKYCTALIRLEKEEVWTQARESKKVPYKGPVLNLEVEEDESYTANGINTHNCWKLGQSFMKASNNEKCYYGRLYRERKKFEVERNDTQGNVERAKLILTQKKWDTTTDTYKWLTGCYRPGILAALLQLDDPAQRLSFLKKHEQVPNAEFGMLPPAQIDAQARRWVVKLFLSHLHTVWWWIEYGKLPERPYALQMLGHAHEIDPPGTDIVAGFDTAWSNRQYRNPRT